MKRICPQCQQQHKTDAYQCPECGSFYSKLDKILAEEQLKQQRQTVKYRLKMIIKAKSPKKAWQDEWQRIKAETPHETFLALAVIFCFIFALMVSVF
jgi:uncharacterized membrane protein YvbJ